MHVLLGGIVLLALGAGAQLTDDLSREQLKPLTAFRQQHRRLVLVDYDAQRSLAAANVAAEVQTVRSLVNKFGKAQRAAEEMARLVEVLLSVLLGGVVLLVLGAGAQLTDDLSREQLKPLTARGLLQVDGRLCAAAFVQVVESGVDSWGYCGATDWVVDYDAQRSLAAANVAAEVQTVRSLVNKFGKAQRAAEETLEMCDGTIVAVRRSREPEFLALVLLGGVVLLVLGAGAQLTDDLSREQLKPLTARGLLQVDGRLCAAAFVQVVESGVDSWGYCGATDWVVDYDAQRSLAAANVAAEVQTVRSLVNKFGKAQRAAEETLEMCDGTIVAVRRSREPEFLVLLGGVVLLVLGAGAQLTDDLSREQLKPLTARGLLQVDGRLCAAAFVQVVESGVDSWGYCGATDWVVDYDAQRSLAAANVAAEVQTVRSLVNKFGKAQRAAEETLEMCDGTIVAVRRSREPEFLALVLLGGVVLLVLGAGAQLTDDLSREQLKPLTARGLLQVDGRLCAAAFVQVVESGVDSWGYCGATDWVVDYDAQRSLAAANVAAEVQTVRSLVNKFGKAQRAAEETLEMCDGTIVAVRRSREPEFLALVLCRVAWSCWVELCDFVHAEIGCFLEGVVLLVLGAGAQLTDDLSREQLKPLTAFRQQHRRLVRFLIRRAFLPVVDYDAQRSLAAANVAAEVQTVRSLVNKFGKAQRAAELTLEMCDG
ncbi:unnamed protein product [Symbiodinium sp. CCMP2592]|nr:unnamed protein product [Symbiodinium sp. CCMP2592]